MRLTNERLRAMTLARQFPAIGGRGRRQLLELFGRLGPIQSQVPRAPFLTAASRLPGITYRTINDAFADHQLLKATNLRGTVHTCVVDQFGAVDAARRPQHARDLSRTLKIDPDSIPEVTKDIEAFCTDDWRQRQTIVDHVRNRLKDRHPAARLDELDQTFGRSLVWGHSALVRKPRDDHWEQRTDNNHRTARRAADKITTIDYDAAITALTRIHLGSYGPASRRDIAWWLGVPLGTVDRALAVLDQELVHHTGPDGSDLVDLAEIPTGRVPDLGVRLLPEFDGLLLGYAPEHRDRFIDHDQLDRVRMLANGQFSPTVLSGGRIVGSWRTRGTPAATIVEISPFAPGSGLTEDGIAAAVGAVAVALDLVISEVRIVSASV